MTDILKSRTIPLSDYFSILQQEYISYYVRSKIYPENYSKKYTGYCLGKKDKILKISDKNSFGSIFSSDNLKNNFISKFLNPYSLPNFEYRDDESIRIMGFWDKVYWFKENTDIVAKLDSGKAEFKVFRNQVKNNSVIISSDNKLIELSYDYITRVIFDDLLDF